MIAFIDNPLCEADSVRWSLFVNGEGKGFYLKNIKVEDGA